MTTFQLDERLQQDCHELLCTDDTHVLLMNNALLPWFILVPETRHTELHRLPAAQFTGLMQLQNQVALFVETHFQIDKINIGAIGNIVSQLHVHVVGRRQTDHCWPGVPWGTTQKEPWSPDAIETIRHQLRIHLGLP